ncbi:MAG: ATP synthase F1 subunit delta [Planctomycetes bacterium]|nr:ATP synthase F1 subunit delta [Planctomycetota bacterium]
MTLLAKRYATALHLLTEAQGATAAVEGDLRALHEVLRDPGARLLLTSPDVGAAERGRILARLAAGRHALVERLLGVLQHRRRLEVMFDLFPAFRALCLAERGEVEGVAETPHPLDDAQVAALQDLAGRLSGQKVALTVALRPELLGGVRLRLGNVLYDGSMQSALAQLEQKLLQAAI